MHSLINFTRDLKMMSGTVRIASGTRKGRNSTKSILQSQYYTNTKSELGHNRN